MVRPMIELNGTGLNIKQLFMAANGKTKITITKDLKILDRVNLSQQKIQQAVAAGEVIYGVTTGFGGMSNFRISSKDAIHMQQNMLWAHKAGVGKCLSKKDVRAAMILRANSHLRGNSGVRLLLIERLLAFLNNGFTPCVPELGSIGASGDLIPLSYIAGAIIGHRSDYKVEINGRKISSIAALKRLKMKPLTLNPKEALAMLNGTSMMTAIAAVCWYETEELFFLALHIQALLFQGLNGSLLSFHPFLQKNKPHPGQVWIAESMMELLEDSLLVRKNDGFNRNPEFGLVQDRYSLRCLPQYLGPILENMWHIKRQIEIEMNSSNDNPLINPKTGEIFYGGNFLGESIGIGMDQLRMMLGLVTKGLDVQIALLVEPRFSRGLSPCLVGNINRVVNVGFKALQILGNSIMPLISFFGNPIADRFPTHAEQFNQNINSQGFNSANLARQSIELFRKYLSLSLLFAVQSVDLRAHLVFGSYDGGAFLSRRTKVLYQKVREITRRPSNPEKPWLWNDDEHKLDEQVARLNEDLLQYDSSLKTASKIRKERPCLD
jgi:phenylalanine ammonia-lyase